MYRKKTKEAMIEKIYRKCIDKKPKEVIIEKMYIECIGKNLKK